MKLQSLIDACGLSPVTVPDAGREILRAYTSDLLSDVMANCPDESLLITIQAHANTIAVATLVGAEAVLICHNREVPEDMRETAAREGVAILQTPLGQFEASCCIGQALS